MHNLIISVLLLTDDRLEDNDMEDGVIDDETEHPTILTETVCPATPLSSISSRTDLLTPWLQVRVMSSADSLMRLW